MVKKDKSRVKILVLLFVGVLMGALDISIVGPVIPSVEASMYVEERMITWMFAIYVLFNLVGIPLFAKLSDLHGRKVIYIVSVFIFAVGSLIVALSTNYDVLLIGRSVQGFGSSGIFPVASAVVGDIYPPEKRGRILGILGAVFGIAFVIGPAIAGIMLTFFTWHALFLINIPITLYLIIFAFRDLPNNKIKSVTRIDWRGIMMLGILLAAFAFGINQIDASAFWNSFLSIDVYPYLLIFIIFLTLFVFSERNVKNPVIKVGIFKRQQVIIAALIAVGTGFTEASFVFIPKFTVLTFGVNTAHASFMLLPLVLAAAAGSPIFGRLIDRIGSKRVIKLGLLLPAIGFLLLSTKLISLFIFYFSGLFIGLGLSILSGSSLRYIMLNEVSADDRASSQGIVTIFQSTGRLLGGAIIGVLLAIEKDQSGFDYLFVLLSVMLIVLFIMGFGLKSRVQEIKTATRTMS